MTLDELTDRIVAWEAERSATPSPPDRRQVREELHDVDLPALDDRGVVTFNADEGIVGSSDAERDLELYPDARTEPEPPVRHRSVHRTHVAVAVGVALLVILLTVAVFGQFVAAALTGGLVALAAVTIAAYRVIRRRRGP